MEPQINYLAVLVGAVYQFFLGFIWYSLLFGKAWQKAVNLSEEAMKKGVAQAFIGSFIASLVMAFVLAHFVDYAGADTFAEGLQSGFWSWLGFVATISLMNTLFSRNSFTLYFIDNGYQLVSLLGMGAILAVWK